MSCCGNLKDCLPQQQNYIASKPQCRISAYTPQPQMSPQPTPSYATPPASYSTSGKDNFQPPQVWETVPDISLFPPPPPYILQHDESFTTNASHNDFLAANDWCNSHPLFTHSTAQPDHFLQAQDIQDYILYPPASVRAAQGLITTTGLQPHQDISPCHRQGPTTWRISTIPTQGDLTWILGPPIFSADHMRTVSGPFFLYYEVHIISAASSDGAIVLGYSALPYPDFRLPGWHRGSVAVHGDDGRRYINDPNGGIDFVDPFRDGEVVGFGMRFEPYGNSISGYKIICFFTRNGIRESSWDLHEEVDQNIESTLEGLEGQHDLYINVGTYNKITCEIETSQQNWLYKGVNKGQF